MAATTSVIAAVSTYLSCALLLSIGALAFPAALRWGSGLAARAPERWLTFGWLLLAFALLAPPAWRVAGMRARAGAPVEIWSGPKVDAESPARVSLRWTASVATPAKSSLRPIPQALSAGIALLAAGAVASLGRLLVRRRRLGRVCGALPIVKRLGKVRICASDEAPAPFAARAAGIAFIVVPTGLLAETRRLRMVIGHEAHHHRRGDLHAAAFFGVLSALFFWNPLLALWERAMAELQDLACDRRVVRRPRVTAIEYSRALLWAAENVHGRRYVIPGARGIADGSRSSLTRRIVMLTEKPIKTKRLRGWFLAAAAGLLMMGASWAVQGAVADHRVTEAEVHNWASRIEKRSGFPVFVDERVVARLNDWVADPAARQHFTKAMGRMPTYRSMIETTLRAHGLPLELLGMVMAESCFDNEAHPDTPIEQRSMGIWQIIPQTARQLGLQVSPTVDERLEPRQATEAAAALLDKLIARYRDWPVAIAAYNAGEKKVDQLAAGANSREEVRARVLAGENEHAEYVRAVMGSIILIDNPSLLE